MTNPKLITKFLAWMDLFDKGRRFELIEARENEKGERCFECIPPKLEKKISGIDKDHEKAFEKFFENFSKEADAYLKENPEIKKELDKQIEIVEKKEREDVQKRKASLNSDVSKQEFIEDLDVAMNILTSASKDVSTVLSENASNLYIKIVGRDYFDKELPVQKIKIQMNLICTNEILKTDNVLLFANCKVTDSLVILLGVIEKM